jgi:hypothetical protein
VYEACGLRLRSELALPGLRRSAGTGAEVAVRRGPVDGPDGYPSTGIAAVPGAQADRLAWYGRARLRVADGEVVADGDDEAFLRQCVVGPGLGVLLHRRGRLVLHGSAVEVDGRAVVLLGEKGAGKSTTAAALLARGHALVTDDLVALAEPPGGGAPLIAPGPAQMKLWPEAAEAVGVGGETRPFAEGFAKGVWLGARLAALPAPVGLVCTLAWGDRLGLTPIAGAAAFGGVFGHAYAPRFLGAGAAAVLVEPVARFVGAVSVRRLVRPKELDGVGAVVRALEAAVRGG